MYGLIVADVSGHGGAASLIMSMFKVLLKIQASQTLSPKETLDSVNRIFLSEVKTDNFVTVFYAIINLRDKTVVFTSAGHNQILFLRENDQIYMHKADGLFLGVFENMILKDNTISYQEKLRIILYTDGVTEAGNPGNEMYSLERLTRIFQRTAAKPVKEALEIILADMEGFLDGCSPQDDITLLVAEFK